MQRTYEDYQRATAALQQAVFDQLPRRTRVEGSRIYQGLFQGQAPPCGPLLSQMGFDTIVLCAEEWQPPGRVDPVCAAILGYNPSLPAYPGVEVVYAPADDDFDQPPSAPVLGLASKAASVAAQRVLQGGRVLVTCWMGKNRSGLVTALALHGLTGLGGAQILQHIRKARPQALTNPQFRDAISRIRSV
jgi:hypothetical protein